MYSLIRLFGMVMLLALLPVTARAQYAMDVVVQDPSGQGITVPCSSLPSGEFQIYTNEIDGIPLYLSEAGYALLRDYAGKQVTRRVLPADQPVVAAPVIAESAPADPFKEYDLEVVVQFGLIQPITLAATAKPRGDFTFRARINQVVVFLDESSLEVLKEYDRERPIQFRVYREGTFRYDPGPLSPPGGETDTGTGSDCPPAGSQAFTLLSLTERLRCQKILDKGD